MLFLGFISGTKFNFQGNGPKPKKNQVHYQVPRLCLQTCGVVIWNSRKSRSALLSWSSFWVLVSEPGLFLVLANFIGNLAFYQK